MNRERSKKKTVIKNDNTNNVKKSSLRDQRLRAVERQNGRSENARNVKETLTSLVEGLGGGGGEGV
jgi:hypothetical protein